MVKQRRFFGDCSGSTVLIKSNLTIALGFIVAAKESSDSTQYYDLIHGKYLTKLLS